MAKHCAPNQCYLASIEHSEYVESLASNETISLDQYRGCLYVRKRQQIDVGEFERHDPILVRMKLLANVNAPLMPHRFEYDDWALRLERIELPQHTRPLDDVARHFTLQVNHHRFKLAQTLKTIQTVSIAACFQQCQRLMMMANKADRVSGCFGFAICSGPAGLQCSLSDHVFDTTASNSSAVVEQDTRCRVYRMNAREMFVVYPDLRIEGVPITGSTLPHISNAAQCAVACIQTRTCKSFTFAEQEVEEQSPEQCRLYDRHMFDLYHSTGLEYQAEKHERSNLYSGTKQLFFRCFDKLVVQPATLINFHFHSISRQLDAFRSDTVASV